MKDGNKNEKGRTRETRNERVGIICAEIFRDAQPRVLFRFIIILQLSLRGETKVMLS